MTLLKQTELFYPINKYGCNFRSLQAMAETNLNLSLNYDTIIDLHSIALNMSWIDSECTVQQPEQIVNSVFKFFKRRTRAWNCGKVKNGEAVNWKGHPTAFDYCIIKLWQPNMEDKHFVLGDTNYNLVFDPYPNSASAKAWNVKDIYLYSFFEV